MGHEWMVTLHRADCPDTNRTKIVKQTTADLRNTYVKTHHCLLTDQATGTVNLP